jgi:hypothetical protein
VHLIAKDDGNDEDTFFRMTNDVWSLKMMADGEDTFFQNNS